MRTDANASAATGTDDETRCYPGSGSMRRFFLVLLALPLLLFAAACGGGGGGSSVSSGDAAVVDGEHITQADLDHQLQETACRYKLQKRSFPKAGSTEYQNLQQQIVATLVQRVQLDQKAPSLGVKVTDKQVEAQLKRLKKQYFGGDENPGGHRPGMTTASPPFSSSSVTSAVRRRHPRTSPYGQPAVA